MAKPDWGAIQKEFLADRAISGISPLGGLTVDGNRTLGPKEIGDMNEMKKGSRYFNALFEKRPHGALMNR